MTPFATFALLYMTAIYLELAERWTYPIFTLVTLGLLILIALTGVTRITFLVFLAVTTAQFVLVQFPDVANHVNLALYCNVVMMTAIVYSLTRVRAFPTDDDYFGLIRPLLQLAAVMVYVVAGFHKLNSDFFNTDVSCVNTMLGNLLRIPQAALAGSPSGLLFVGGVLVLAYALLSLRLKRSGCGGTGALLSVIALAGVTFGQTAQAEPPSAGYGIILTTIAIVIAWELAGGLLLLVPRFQGPIVAFSWMMHSTLALIGFVDFAALALALLFTFVPAAYLDLLRTPVRLPWGGQRIHRAQVYVALSVLVGVVSSFHNRLMAGVLYVGAALIFLWPIVSGLASGRPLPRWTGVPIVARNTPAWMFVFPALLMLHGLTSYLGLRTAGNFTMFSNLRTEGAVSNHFLLGSNPLKLWDYQEDVIRVIEINDRKARIGYQYQALKGKQLPVVEFRKLLYRWGKAGVTVPMTFEYRGRVHSTQDVANDPRWRTGKRDPEMALMDFRVIQPGGANRCRW